MGASKAYYESIEQFFGVNYTKSDKTRPIGSFRDISNLERLPSGALRGREGFKLSAQPLYMAGIHTYEYSDEEGNIQQELLGIGVLNVAKFDSGDSARGKMAGTLFRLKEGTFTVSYSGASAWKVDIRPNGSSGSGIDFIITENGATVLTKSLGFGYESSPVDFSELASSITAITNFSASAPKTAVVNGAQSGVTQVTVDSGHTVSVGDWIEFASSVPATNGTGREIFEVIATSSTTLDFMAIPSRDFADNAVLGHGSYPAAILDFHTEDAAVESSRTYSYWYWEPVPCLTFRNGVRTNWPFSFLEDNFEKQENRQPTFCNDNNCCYISAAYATSLDLQKIVGTLDTVKLVTEDFSAGVWKYDGVNFYMSGPVNINQSLETPANIFTSTNTGSGINLGTGTYKYRISIVKTDAKGQETESFLEFTDSHGANGDDVELTFYLTLSDVNYIDWDFFDFRYAVADGDVTTANTSLTVDAGHKIRTGDYIYFKDYSAALQRRKVVGWTNTTITLDEAATIADNEVISNTLARFWRTVVGGNELLLLGGIVVKADESSNAAVVAPDAVSDTGLGVIESSVKQETLQYNFPAVNALTTHQELLVAAGGPGLPQEIGWEDPLYPESFDKARLIRKVPGTQTGGLNALVSHTDNTLIITKCGAIYKALGSFESNEVDITKIVENSYGARGTNAVAAIGDILVGACGIGMWSLDRSNNFSTVLGEALLKLFRKVDVQGQTTYPFESRRMVFAYDYNKQWIHVFLPRERVSSVSNFSITPYIVSTDTFQYYVIQLPQTSEQQALITRFELPDRYNPGGGFQNYDGGFYWQTRPYYGSGSFDTFLLKRQEDEVTLGEDLFTDNGVSYDWVMEAAWDDLGDTEHHKVWHEFFYYQLEPDYFINEFSVAFESNRDWLENGSGYTDTDTVRATALTFSSAYTKEGTIYFDKGYKAKRRNWKLSGTVYKNPPIISGYGYSVSSHFGDNKPGRSQG